MIYKYDNFLRPLTEYDNSIKIIDSLNNIKYSIDPFVINNVLVSNNLIIINLRSKVIKLNFSSKNEAILALPRIKEQIDYLTNKTPKQVDKEVKRYVENVFEETESGILIPRLTESERDSISAPINSMLIFNSDSKSFQYYFDSVWYEVGVSAANYQAVLENGSSFSFTEGNNAFQGNILEFDAGIDTYRTTQLLMHINGDEEKGSVFRLDKFSSLIGSYAADTSVGNYNEGALISLDGVPKIEQTKSSAGIIGQHILKVEAGGEAAVVFKTPQDTPTGTYELATREWVGEQTKEAIFYIGSQDSTGFLGLVEKKNTTGTTFTFTRDGVGTFLFGGFDKTKHILTHSITSEASNHRSTLDFTADDELYTQYIASDTGIITKYDYAFLHGGWIIIRQID